MNQNIARNWAISPNLGRKIKTCPFWLKSGTQGIMEVLIPNPDLDFRNSDPKIYFWANLGPTIQSFLFCLKIGTPTISRKMIPNLDLDLLKFWPKNPFLAGQIWAQKFKVVSYICKLPHIVYQGCWFWIQT